MLERFSVAESEKKIGKLFFVLILFWPPVCPTSWDMLGHMLDMSLTCVLRSTKTGQVSNLFSSKQDTCQTCVQQISYTSLTSHSTDFLGGKLFPMPMVLRKPVVSVFRCWPVDHSSCSYYCNISPSHQSWNLEFISCYTFII